MALFEINIFWYQLQANFYWLMYAFWFLLWYFIIYKRNIINRKDLDNLFVYIFLWVLLWGRLGYVLFYNFNYYLSNPIDIFKFWNWWMSFHWWVIWVILAMALFSRRHKFSFLKLADQITLVLPIWLWLGRIWNYMNQELLGFSGYNWFLAVIKDWKSYFPSPLLEAFLEWIILYFILYFFYKRKNLSDWQISALFLIFYAIFRIFVEVFFRTPDVNIWYILGFLTMWEILSLPMLIAWIFFYFKFKK